MPVREGYDPLEGVLLLWEWEKHEDRNGRWVHRDTIADDGRRCIDHWMYTPQTDDDHAMQPIMGRMVTVWSVGAGIGIVDIHPPEWSPYIVDRYILDVLRRDRAAMKILDGAGDIYPVTLDVVRSLLDARP